MFNAEAYKLARENLLYDTLGLAGLVGSLFPATVRPGSGITRGCGSQWENDDIRIVAKKLEDVTHRFDELQHSLGLWQHDARFGHGPDGSTNPPTEEDHAMADAEKAPERGRAEGQAATTD